MLNNFFRRRLLWSTMQCICSPKLSTSWISLRILRYQLSVVMDFKLGNMGTVWSILWNLKVDTIIYSDHPPTIRHIINTHINWDQLTTRNDIRFYTQVEMNGLTGKIKFDQKGQRTDFELDIIELKRDGLTKVRNIFWSAELIFHTIIPFTGVFRLAVGQRSVVWIWAETSQKLTLRLWKVCRIKPW